jgi:hypothetical protein
MKEGIIMNLCEKEKSNTCVGSCKIFELFEKDLEIPEYQRPYAWEKEQVQALLNDLYEAFTKNQPNYLVGNIILHRRDGNKYDIVDGQQRCITFALIFRVKEGNGSDINIPLLEKEVSVLSQAALVENYRIIQNYFSSLGENEKKEFFKFLEERVMVTYTVAESLDEAFFYFDSQNTRGRPLARKDLLKVHHYRFFPKDSEALQRKVLRRWERLERCEDGSDCDPIETFLKDNLAIARKAVRGELAGDHLKYNDVFKEFQSLGGSRQLNRYNQPPIFERFDYDFDSDILQLTTMPISFQAPYTLMEGLRHLPFEVTQSIDGGENFFYYVFKYMELEKRLRENELYVMFDKLGDAGNIYSRKIYKSALLFYYDKFGVESFEKFAYFLYFLLGYFRLVKDSIRKEGVAGMQWDGSEKFDPFKEIYLAYAPEHLLTAMGRYMKFRFKEELLANLKENKETVKNIGTKRKFLRVIPDKEKAKRYFEEIHKDIVWEVG